MNTPKAKALLVQNDCQADAFPGRWTGNGMPAWRLKQGVLRYSLYQESLRDKSLELINLDLVYATAMGVTTGGFIISVRPGE